MLSDRLLALIALLLVLPLSVRGDEPERERRTGTVQFQPSATEANVPSQFRLEPHEFQFRQEFHPDIYTGFRRSDVTFPSPVVTPYEENNTVHCEYFRPQKEGKRPGVIVLHILGGDFELSRLFCNALSQHGTAALFVKLPYYGPRRPAGSRVRMISPEPQQTVDGMTQAVLDIRRAAAWLAAQKEIDPDRIGIFGISLGGITGALAMSAEPRFQKGCLVLAGGDLGQIADAAWSSPQLAKVRENWLAQGETKESLFGLLKTIDPVTYAANCRGRDVLMLNATDDEIIPRACTESLWLAFGKPEIVWYKAGHTTAALYLLDAIHRVTQFFWKDPAR